MQKIKNLRRYTNTEIGLVRDADTAEANFKQILTELKEAVAATPGLRMAEIDEEEIPF